MRDPQRIDKVLGKLGVLWRENPDLRLGQLILNLHREIYPGDLFYLEDSVLEGLIDAKIQNPVWDDEGQEK